MNKRSPSLVSHLLPPSAGALCAVSACQVQVPVEFLEQTVVLEALVSPVPHNERDCIAARAAGSGGGSTSTHGSTRAGVGGEFAHRLDSLFALSR